MCNFLFLLVLCTRHLHLYTDLQQRKYHEMDVILQSLSRLKMTLQVLRPTLPSTSNIIQCMLLRATNKAKIELNVFIITSFMCQQRKTEVTIYFLPIYNQQFTTIAAVPPVLKTAVFCKTEDLPLIMPPITCYQVKVNICICIWMTTIELKNSYLKSFLFVRAVFSTLAVMTLLQLPSNFSGSTPLVHFSGNTSLE